MGVHGDGAWGGQSSGGCGRRGKGLGTGGAGGRSSGGCMGAGRGARDSLVVAGGRVVRQMDDPAGDWGVAGVGRQSRGGCIGGGIGRGRPVGAEAGRADAPGVRQGPQRGAPAPATRRPRDLGAATGRTGAGRARAV